MMALQIFETCENFSAVIRSLVLLAVFLLYAQPSYSDPLYYPQNGPIYYPPNGPIYYPPNAPIYQPPNDPFYYPPNGPDYYPDYNGMSSEDSSSDIEDKFSTPEECKRECRVGDYKTCYFHFHIEYYTTVNRACDQNSTMYQCVKGDGFEKTVYTINRQIPAPAIEVCEGDRLVIDVENEAEGLELTIHWHGIFQEGYQYYDGVPYLTQCPIRSGSTFRYTFVLRNAGTHFYHSHESTQMADGLYGPLIVRKPCKVDPHCKDYDDDDNILLMSDWFHELSLERFPGKYRSNQGQVPENILINGKGSWTDPATNRATNVELHTIEVEKGKRYRIRIINSFSSVCLARVIIHGHTMSVMAQDGEDVKSVDVESLISASGERTDIILHANKRVDSYWIEVRGVGECEEKKVRQFAILKYKGASKTPSAPKPTYTTEYTGREYNTLNVTDCEEQKKHGRYCISSLEGLEEDCDSNKQPDIEQLLSFGFYNFDTPEDQFPKGEYKRYLAAVDKSQVVSLVANKSFSDPASAIISQRKDVKTLCNTNSYPSTCTRPCYCTNAFDIPRYACLQMILFDVSPFPGLNHPFHLHGTAFKVLEMGYLPGTPSPEVAFKIMQEYDAKRGKGGCKQPSSKDTIIVPTGGYVILSFCASNPGYWLFHCHFTWHAATGMNVVIHVGDDDDLPPVPPGFPTCDNFTPDPFMGKRKSHHHHQQQQYRTSGRSDNNSDRSDNNSDRSNEKPGHSDNKSDRSNEKSGWSNNKLDHSNEKKHRTNKKEDRRNDKSDHSKEDSR